MKQAISGLAVVNDTKGIFFPVIPRDPSPSYNPRIQSTIDKFFKYNGGFIIKYFFPTGTPDDFRKFLKSNPYIFIKIPCKMEYNL